MALLSQIVYDDHHKINTKLLKMGLQDWAWFERDGTQGMIINNNSEIIICFRGTEPDQMTHSFRSQSINKRSQERGSYILALHKLLIKLYEMSTYL